MQWQQNKDNNPTTYAEFKTGDGTELTGETKKLAEMMYKGIDHYPVYIPVVSITLKTGDPPQLGLYPIGSLHAEPEVPFGWDLAGESDMDEIISGVKDSETGEKFAYWIITSSRSAANSDGTFSWTIQYQGATSIETELFS